MSKSYEEPVFTGDACSWLGLCRQGSRTCGGTRRGNCRPSGGKGVGGGAAHTLCDRSQRDALTVPRSVSSAGKMGRVATTAWILPSWVVMVSSSPVMDASPLRAEQERGMRIVSPSESAESS